MIPRGGACRVGLAARPRARLRCSRRVGVGVAAPSASNWRSSTPLNIFRLGCIKKGATDKQILGGGALGFELQYIAGVVLCCRHPGRTADRTVQSHRGGPSPSVDRAAPDCRPRCGHPQTRRRRAAPSGCGKRPSAFCWNPRPDQVISGDLGFLPRASALAVCYGTGGGHHRLPRREPRPGRHCGRRPECFQLFL